jgi:hypothetical protein
MRVVAAYVAAVALLVFALEQGGAGAVEVYAACLLAALVIPLVFAWLSRFEPKTADTLGGMADKPSTQ